MTASPTIRQVADIAGVSASTASRVLSGGRARTLCSDESVMRVEKAAERLGYRANYHMRSMRVGRSHAIGFSTEAAWICRARQYGSWYFDQIREGVEAAALDAGMNVMIIRPDGRQTAFERSADYLRDRRLDALVVPRQYAVAADQATPGRPGESLNIVTVDGMDGLGYPHVGFNAEAGLVLLARHLRELGHRRVLWFGPGAPGSNPELVPREQMFLRAAFAVGLSGEAVFWDGPARGAFSIDAAFETLQEQFAARLRQMPRRSFTAVVGYSDSDAVAAQRALIAAGLRVPQDVSVTGFDDSWAMFGSPPITTVDHKLFIMGREAGGLAIERFEQRRKRAGSQARDGAASAPPAASSPLLPPDFPHPLAPPHVVQPDLIVRASTGPAA